jgi:O-antigen ligase
MESFSYVFSKNYDYHMYRHEQWFERTHNVLLDWLVAAGVFGFCAYLSLFIFALWILWKKTPDFGSIDRSVLTGLLTAYFFNNLFFFDNLISYLLFFSVLAYIHTVLTRSQEPLFMRKVNKPIIYGVIPVIVVSLGLSLYFLNARPILVS